MVSGGRRCYFPQCCNLRAVAFGPENQKKNLPMLVEAAVREWMDPSKGRKRGGGRGLVGKKKVSEGGERKTAMK